MKQIRFSSFGAPSQVAKCVEVADVGAPSSWEVVVDIEAFPINFADLAMLAGAYGTLPKPPATIGMEAVGRIAQCGSSVTNLAVGDRVVILANNNWAERRKVPAAAVHKVSSEGPVEQLAMLKVNLATGYLMLKHAIAHSRYSWVIQNAPLSSVGRSVVQLAKQMKVRTINIVRSADAIPEVLALGGDVVLEDGPDLAGRVRAAVKQDVVVGVAFDAVAGPGTQRLAECLSEGGQIVNYGMLSNQPHEIQPDQTIFRGITLSGFWLSKTLNRLSLPERTSFFDELANWVVDQKLRIDVDSYFPIHRIGEALARAEQGKRNGKVLVVTDYSELKGRVK
jgi:mitochondrial enoyl-[acyl-carrier protein] reductase / trans-2-enoyl-CoA reductase